MAYGHPIEVSRRAAMALREPTSMKSAIERFSAFVSQAAAVVKVGLGP